MDTRIVEKELVKIIKRYPILNNHRSFNHFPLMGMIIGLIVGIIINYLVYRFVYSNQIPNNLFSHLMGNYNSLTRIKGGSVYFDILIIPIFFALVGTLLGKKLQNI